MTPLWYVVPSSLLVPSTFNASCSPYSETEKNKVFHLQIIFLQVQFTMLIDNKSLILKVTKYGCVRYLHILAQCKDIGTVRYTVPVRYKNNISKF